MVSCCHINAIIKPIIYFIIICFMENKYWSNPKMFISKAEDIDPVTAHYYEVFASFIMPDDWGIANWIILSYGNWCSWVIFFHGTGGVEFLPVLWGQFRLPFLFIICMIKHLISCLSVAISLKVFQRQLFLRSSSLLRAVHIVGERSAEASLLLLGLLSLKFCFQIFLLTANVVIRAPIEK